MPSIRTYEEVQTARAAELVQLGISEHLARLLAEDETALRRVAARIVGGSAARTGKLQTAPLGGRCYKVYISVDLDLPASARRGRKRRYQVPWPVHDYRPVLPLLVRETRQPIRRTEDHALLTIRLLLSTLT